jgi:hypothetical protein
MEGRIRNIPQEKWRSFWTRAESFHEGLGLVRSNRDDACVSMAVHCSMAALDAFTVFHLKERSAAQNHFEVVPLLKKINAKDEAAKKQAEDSFRQLANLKMVAEYNDRNTSKAEADKAIALCEKIYRFVESELKSAGAFP